MTKNSEIKKNLTEDEGMLLQEYQVCKCTGSKLIDIQHYDELEEAATEQIEIYDQEVNNLCHNFNLFTLNNEQLDHIKKLIAESGLEADREEGISFVLDKESLYLLNRTEEHKDIYEEVFKKETCKLVYDIAKYLDDSGFEIYDILEETRWRAR